MTDQKIARASKKAPLALIPFIWLWGIARVLAYGAKKYAKGNHYAATLEDGAGERYVSAAMRHCGAMQLPDGTFTPESLASLDDESGLPHIDHAMCSLGILRGIMVKCGALPADPGEGKEPPKVAPAPRIPPKGACTWDAIAEHYENSDRPIPPVDFKAPEDSPAGGAVIAAALGRSTRVAEPTVCVSSYPCRDCRQQEYCAGGCGATR